MQQVEVPAAAAAAAASLAYADDLNPAAATAGPVTEGSLQPPLTLPSSSPPLRRRQCRRCSFWAVAVGTTRLIRRQFANKNASLGRH